MRAAKLALGGICAFILMFLLAWMWNGVLAAEFYAHRAPAVQRAPADVGFGALLLGYLALTSAIGLTYRFAPGTGSRWLGGFIVGAAVGATAFVPGYLLLYGGWDVSASLLFVDALWHVLEQGLGGVVFAVLAPAGAAPPRR